jgi:hypothetical protein
MGRFRGQVKSIPWLVRKELKVFQAETWRFQVDNEIEWAN